MTRPIKRTSTDSLTTHLRPSGVGWPKTAELPENETDREVVLTHYRDIVSTRTAADWSTAEMTMAASLARMMLQLDRASASVLRDGPIMTAEGSKGQAIDKLNPLIDVQSRLSASVNSLASKLHLFAHQKADSRSVAAQGKIAPAQMNTPTSQPKSFKDRHQ